MSDINTSTRLRLISILIDYAGERVADFTDQSSLVDDLGIDSLELVAITMAIENEFNIVIPSDIMAGMPTIGDLVALISDRLEFLAQLEAAKADKADKAVSTNA